MAVAQHRRAVGVFSNRRDAETALRELRDSNFPMDRVSVITQDAAPGNMASADMRNDVREDTGNKADEGAATGAATGGALGTLTGLLVGLGALAIPGIGPIMLAGATATAIATTLAGGAIGAAVGSLLGSLIGLGIPEERAKVYHDRISRGHYLVIVEGTDAEIDRAQAILHNRGIEEWGVYDMPNTSSTPRSALVHNKRAVGVFPHRRDAETAIKDLRDAGFPMSQVSLVVSDRDRDYGIADIDVRDRFDNGLFGFPQDRARFYNDRFDRGEYLVIVDGTEDEVRRAEAIMRRRGIQDWGIFDIPESDRFQRTPRPGYVAAATPRPGVGREHHEGREHRAIGVFPHRRDAEAALTELRDAGFNMDDVSIVGKNLDSDHPIAGVETRNRATGNKADDGAKAGAATGGALGGLGGLLVGLGALAIPGIGPVIAGGALATALATTAAGGAIGAAAGGLTGALVGLGIPEEEALRYNDRVNRGDYLVMVDGTDDEIHRAQAILSRHGIQEWGIYDKSDVGAGHGRTGDRDRDIVRDVDRNRPGYATAAVATPTPEITHSTHSQHKHGVGFFHNHQDAENALAELRAAGFPMRQVSLVVRDYDRYNAIPGVEVRDRFDNSLFGFPGDRVHDYNSRLGRGEYMVMVHGTDDDIRRAEAILSHSGIRDWWFHDPSQVSATRQVIDQDKYDVGNRGPEVIIIDRRDETV